MPTPFNWRGLLADVDAALRTTDALAFGPEHPADPEACTPASRCPGCDVWEKSAALRDSLRHYVPLLGDE